MYARVASWEGGDADAIRRSAEGIQQRGEQGPPEGVPAVGFLLLVDPDNGRAMGISLFETEDDMRQGDATLNTMNPPEDGLGTRNPVQFYEVAADFKA
jgi:hypothetical protein